MKFNQVCQSFLLYMYPNECMIMDPKQSLHTPARWTPIKDPMMFAGHSGVCNYKGRLRDFTTTEFKDSSSSDLRPVSIGLGMSRLSSLW